MVYTVRKPSTSTTTTEIIHANSKDEFLSRTTTSSLQFQSDVKQACSGIKKHIQVGDDKRIYVYQDSNGSWIYSSSLQDLDWVKIPWVKGLVERTPS